MYDLVFIAHEYKEKTPKMKREEKKLNRIL